MIRSVIRKIVPRSALRTYHRTLTIASAMLQGFPSRRMLVIGITGTTGKSTVAEFLSVIFEKSGRRVGMTSTIRFRIGGESWLNDEKMTMMGRGRLQALLARMVRAECSVAIIETTSEGIAQGRHLGIDYDAAVFTNLTPEHIESHGSFEAYRKAKYQLFASLASSYRKTGYAKTIIANLDSSESGSMLSARADRKIGYRCDPKSAVPPGVELLEATSVVTDAQGSRFVVNGVPFSLSLVGTYNVTNALAAIATAYAYGVSLNVAAEALAVVTEIPGRYEFLRCGQPFSVVIDYAHEPAGLEAVYRTARASKPKKLIAVLGAAGGGRDKGKRSTLGELAGRYADLVIVTNEDPYDEDPQSIIEGVAEGVRSAGKRDNKNLFCDAHRHNALRRAFSLAGPGDTVLITGKGSEQSMMIAGGQRVPWSDRIEAQSILVEKYGENSGEKKGMTT